MNILKLALVGAVGALGLATTEEASALPYLILEKGGPSVSNPYIPGPADEIYKDFPTDPATYSFNITGDTSFYGGVAHGKDSATNWVDSWRVDFGSKSYNVVFDWQAVSKTYDGSFLNIATNTVFTTFSGTGSKWVAVLSGVVDFQVNPILPKNNGPQELGYWAVHATAVPVPAALPLLLGGLGVIAAAGIRRRRNGVSS